MIVDPLNAEELQELNGFNAGFAKLLGLHISHCDSERVCGELLVQPQHLQVAGVVNGGVYASIGETIGSIAAIAASGQPAAGMSNNTDFLGAVRSGIIEAEARPVHTGKRTHLWRIEMRHGGKLVATTNLKLMLLDQQL